MLKNLKNYVLDLQGSKALSQIDKEILASLLKKLEERLYILM